MSILGTIRDHAQDAVLQSMQESVRRRQASGRDFLKHVLSDGLDDWSIIAVKPQVFVIGPENRSLYVRALPLKLLGRFTLNIGELLYRYQSAFKGINWLTYNEGSSPEDIEDMASKLDIVFSNCRYLEEADAVCRKVLFADYPNRKWRGRRGRRYWTRHVGADEVLMIFFAMWCLNYETEKKTVDYLLQKVGDLRSGTSLPPSLRRASGRSGKSVKPLYPNSKSFLDAIPKTTTSTKAS